MVDVSEYARVKWHGNWIWGKYVSPRRIRSIAGYEKTIGIKPEEKNIFMLIRKKFKVEKELETATINISADSRYKLFVNGEYIGRGINRCEEYYWYYNTYDVSELLKSGENVIAVNARFYGRALAYYTPPKLPGKSKSNSGKGGVIFDLYLSFKDGTETWLGSDKDCKITRNKGERSDMPLKNGCLGFLEEYDTTKVPKDWNEINF
ncbi:MAG: hypothetical protein GF364_06370, partial [Candidatus Lokiarchaeota archaeon]|nr:hypothetical protein [Candidatus Lokiarchaeota archaeon]